MRALLYLLPALVLGLTDAPAQGELTPPSPPPRPRPAPAPAKPAVPTRIPVPSADERQQAGKLVRDLFKDEYAKRTPEGRQNLATKLLASARGTKDDPAGLYVLLTEAAGLAATAGDVKTAVSAVALLTRRFDVDGAKLQAETLDKARRAVRTPEAARELTGAYLAAAEEARDGDDYDSALMLLKKAESTARSSRDAAVRAGIQEQAREVRDLQKEFRKIQPSLATLQTDPDDPASNKTYGTYLCFIKGSWKEGLPFLARSGDERLEKVARLEKSASEKRDAGIRCDLAELYYQIAEESKSTPLVERSALARSLGWYQDALRGNLQGLGRVRAQRRIQEIEEKALAPGFSSARGVYDLIKLTDPRRHKVAGTWVRKGSTLILAERSNYARIRLAMIPRGSYDLEIHFTRTAGSQSMGPVLPVGNRACGLMMSWRTSLKVERFYAGLCEIDGKRTHENATTRDGTLKTGSRHVLQVRVRLLPGAQASIGATLDGKPYLSWKGPIASLAQYSRAPIPDPLCLGFYANETSLIFHRIALRMVSGRAEPVGTIIR